jgi:membrane protease YdiL (CAAX protease family)
MFEEVSQDLLRDMEHIALGILGMGLLLNYMWKTGALGGKRADELSGDITGEAKPHRGKVRSDLMMPIDLFMAVVILAFYYLKFLPTEVNSAATNPVEPGVPGKELILSHFLVTFFMLSFALSTIYIGGRRSANDIFGLTRLALPRWLLWVVGGAVVAGGLVMLLHQVLMKYWLLPTFGDMAVQEAVQTMLTVKDPMVKTLLIVNACLVAPFAEEVLFRGYIYAAVKRYTGPIFSTVVVSLLFAVVHLNIPALWPLWVFAILLTLSYEFSGSLWVPVGIHALFNTFNVALMLSGRDIPL